MTRIIFLAALVLTFSGCCTSQSAADLQISQDEAKLTRMYRECIEKNLGHGEAMRKDCEPILGPYVSH